MILQWIAARTRSSLLSELRDRLQLLEGERKPLVDDEQQRYLRAEIADVKALLEKVEALPSEGIPVLTQVNVDYMVLPYEMLLPEQREALS